MRKIKTSSRGFLVGRMLRLLRISKGFEEPNVREETITCANPQASSKGLMDTHFRSEAYLLSKRRKVEVETEKAMLISLSRHPRWKGAGGPN